MVTIHVSYETKPEWGSTTTTCHAVNHALVTIRELLKIAVKRVRREGCPATITVTLRSDRR